MSPVWCKYLNEPYDIVIRQYYGKSVRAMTNVIQPFHLLAIALTGWLNRHQQAVIDYLIEDNRVLKDQLEGQRYVCNGNSGSSKNCANRCINPVTY